MPNPPFKRDAPAMKSLIGLCLLLASFPTVACEVVPSEVIQSLQSKEPLEVIAHLWDAGECEEKLLTGLASGKAEWINLAVALSPHTDAWASESLQDSLGEAMQRAPSRILPLMANYTFDEAICMPWMMDDSGNADNRYRRQIRRARPMFESFLKTSLGPQARKCLTVVGQLEKSSLFNSNPTSKRNWQKPAP